MPRYHFHISGSVTVDDAAGREIASPFDLRNVALAEAASVSASHASRDEETNILVTVCDLTGAVCLKVRLISQVEPV